MGVIRHQVVERFYPPTHPTATTVFCRSSLNVREFFDSEFCLHVSEVRECVCVCVFIFLLIASGHSIVTTGFRTLGK